MKYLILFISLFCLFVLQGNSQGGQRLKKQREVTVTYPDSTIRADIRTKTKQINVKDNLVYYWFYSDKVNHNIGGYSGSLLDGKYKVFDLKKNLITQGRFHKGIKCGEWKKWNHKNGSCLTDHWKNGIKHGRSIIYSGDGKILSLTHFKNGLKNGKSYYMRNDSIIKTWYKDDKEVAQKPCFIKRIFCKKKCSNATGTDSLNTETKGEKISFFQRIKMKCKKKKNTDDNSSKKNTKVKKTKTDNKEINKESFWEKMKKKFKRNKKEDTKKS